MQWYRAMHKKLREPGTLQARIAKAMFVRKGVRDSVEHERGDVVSPSAEVTTTYPEHRGN